MSSRNTDSLAASWRSQSQICRWISGSVLRRRSARGGKSPPRSPRAGSLLSLLPFLPHQEAVGQHHRHGLRAYDAVQLTAALEVNRRRQAMGLEAVTLVSADRELYTAAVAEGLAVEDPTTHP